MNSDEVKSSIAAYFRYKKQFPIVSFERTFNGYYGNGIPDILCVSKDRKLVEIEVKVSLSDFKADINKSRWKHVYKELEPYNRYFAVPKSIAEACLNVLKEWRTTDHPIGDSGLLVVSDKEDFYGNHEVSQELSPKRNTKAQKLSLKHLSSIVKALSGSICSLYTKLVKLQKGKKERKEVYAEIPLTKEDLGRFAVYPGDSKKPLVVGHIPEEIGDVIVAIPCKPIISVNVKEDKEVENAIKVKIHTCTEYHCAKCNNTNNLQWNQLDEYNGPALETGIDDTNYSCDCKCHGRL